MSELSMKNSSLSEESKSIWTWMCMFPEEVDREGLYQKIVSEILKKVQDAGHTKMLACIMIYVNDNKEIPLYQAAPPRIGKVLSPYVRFVDRYELIKEETTVLESTMVIKAYDSSYKGDDKRSKVAITFHSNRKEFWHEIDVHTELQKTAVFEGINSPVIKIIQNFDMARMGTSQETSDDMKFSRDVTNFNDIYSNISSYPYAIVREESGEINPISNYRDADDKLEILYKKHLKDIAESILCLHKKRVYARRDQHGRFCATA